jgi:hypothetical protein
MRPMIDRARWAPQYLTNFQIVPPARLTIVGVDRGASTSTRIDVRIRVYIDDTRRICITRCIRLRLQASTGYACAPMALVVVRELALLQCGLIEKGVLYVAETHGPTYHYLHAACVLSLRRARVGLCRF